MFDFNNIIKKYNYDKEFSLFLYEVYNNLVSYYGNEDIIYNAFLNTKIINTSNIYEYLKENAMIEQDTLVTEKDLKRCLGIYTSKPLIVSSNNKYKITEIKRVVLVKDFDINSTEKKATLIHELCHMVKSYEEEYIIKSDILLNRSGLIERYYILNNKDNIVQMELIREKGVGLEEGLTTLSEEILTRNIVDKDYKQKGYGAVYILAKKLNEHLNESLVKYASVHHDKDLLYNNFGIDYQELENLSDIVYKLNLKMYSLVFEPEEIETIKKIIIKIIEEYKTVLNKEKGKSK
ncbi:MAG: hypothetical protein IKF91_05415 [Bacilli bacterium]|nr:hypothetical protein [Bacilli bacterium]